MVLFSSEPIILDEPTIGIDPIQVVETRQLIKEIGKDHTLLLSTHILPEVSALCERVLIIHEGNLVAEAQSNINSRYNNFNLEIDGGTAFWNGKNLAGRLVSSGVYIVMLSELETYETKILKIMIIR